MKRKILSNCLKGKYGYHLREFSDTSFVVFGTERVKQTLELSKCYTHKTKQNKTQPYNLKTLKLALTLMLILTLTVTVEPWFNDLRYNNIPGITINNRLPTQKKLQ